MADIRTVKTVDVQLLNANRERPKTYKFDNPKDGLTRAEISAAFTPALANSWLLAADGSVALYLGDTILNTSTKVSLDGEDFYVTPNSLSLNAGVTSTLTVTGAQIQGYNITDISDPRVSVNVKIAENKLTADVTATKSDPITITFNVILIINGTEVTIPCNV